MAQQLFTVQQFSRAPGPQYASGVFIPMPFADTVKWVRDCSPALTSTFLVVCKAPDA